MAYKGINYDTGTKTLTGRFTRETFDLNIVTKEISIIKNELHCNAIRISGVHIERVVQASEIALKQGLTVWFSPSLQYDNPENTVNYIIQSSVAAEQLRSRFSNLIFVAGCELSLFTSGFIKGDTGEERIKNMFGPINLIKNMLGISRKYNSQLNKFLSNAISEIRKHFHGQITYASGTWEKVDWEIFDIIGIDFYRASYNKSTYLKELQNYKRLGKPVSIMEFGCCTYKGAEDKGAMGWAIVDWKKDRPELKGSYIRDEEVQANYLLELLNIFETENVYAVFVFTFISANYIHDDNPRYDLDMASYGVVKAINNNEQGYDQNLAWIPKRAFFELANFYKNHFPQPEEK